VIIEWLTEARIEFRHHIAYIHQQNPNAAIRVDAAIMRRISVLDDFPFAGRPGRLPETRELTILSAPYIVVYRVSGVTVQIMHILHASLQWPPEDE
jgi:plasmid stabilization system protein ParE